MTLHKVHPHRRSCYQHPRASLHRASSPASFGREMLFICPGPPIRLGVPEVPPSCGLPMSSHQMTRHGPSRDYRPTLPARHSIYLSFCIRLPQPCQPPTVSCFGPVSSPCPTGVTGHANCLPEIGTQSHPVEDGYQGAESALEPGGVQRDNHTAVSVKTANWCRPSRPVSPSTPVYIKCITILVIYYQTPNHGSTIKRNTIK